MSSSVDQVSFRPDKVRVCFGKALRTRNGFVEGGLGHLASLVGGVEDFVIEDGEVEGKTKANWVRWERAQWPATSVAA